MHTAPVLPRLTPAATSAPRAQPVLRVHPVLMALFPLFAATCLALLLPPLVYLSFRSEFVGLHPAWPPHFAFLARRLLRALGSGGQLKVSAKEL